MGSKYPYQVYRVQIFQKIIKAKKHKMFWFHHKLNKTSISTNKVRALSEPNNKFRINTEDTRVRLLRQIQIRNNLTQWLPHKG